MNRLRVSNQTLIEKSVVFLLVAILVSNPLTAFDISGQSVFTVKGTVTAPGGQPVRGVIVTEKGTTNIETTDNSGFYQIDVRDGNAILNFKYPLAWNEDIAVGSRSVVNGSLKCSNGGRWTGDGCATDTVVTATAIFGCPAPGQQYVPHLTACLPIVKFHPSPNVTLDSAQAIALQNGWLVAAPDELYNAWKDLKLDQDNYGLLSDGQVAFPIQRDAPPTRMRGANVGVPASNLQGFYYIQKEASPRVQTPPPTAACGSLPANPMLDGWSSRDPILEEAARGLLQKEGQPLSAQNISTLAAQLRFDPVRRWQFAPFMLKEMWKALISPNPTPLQDQFRKRFESWAACDEMSIARTTLAAWNVHIGKSYTTPPQEYCSRRKVPMTSLSGGGTVMMEEPCQWVSVTFLPPRVTSYTYPTLGVLIDTTNGGRWTTKGFLPLENPQYLGYNGREAMALLIKPMLARNMPDFDDHQNLRAVGTDMDRVAQEIGIHGGGLTVVTTVVGAAILAETARLSSTALRTAKMTYDLKIKDLTEFFLTQAQMAGKPIGEAAAKKAAEAVVPQASKLTGKQVGENFLKALLGRGSDDAAKKAGAEIGKKLGTQFGTKIGSIVAVIGIIATFGEIFATVIAESVRTQQLDDQLNKAALALQPFVVKDLLGTNPGPEQKAIVFTKLMKMAIANPADGGLLTLSLPPVDCPSGAVESLMRRCVTEVSFHSQANLTLDQAWNIANTNGWTLATPDEVENAWLDLDLDTNAFGRMTDGRFAVPVQTDFPNFKRGPNLGASGGNQGFFYTTSPVAAAAPGVSWNQRPGNMKNVSVGNDGTAWALDSSDRIFRWNVTGWSNVPGGLKQISVGNASHVWGVNGSDQIFRWNGSSWDLILGSLKHVSVSADGTVWGVNAADQIWRWNGLGWDSIPGKLKQISVGSASNVWGVNASNEIFLWNGSRWTQVPGGLKYVSSGADGSVWGVNPSDEIFMWNGSTWTKIAGGLNQISSGGFGNVWGVNKDGQIVSRSFKGGDQAAAQPPVASTPPAATSSAGTSWKLHSGALKYVSVGSDGTTWALDASDRISRWNGSGWSNVPGGLKQISVGNASHVWGVNGSDQIFRWSGSSWDLILGSLKQVSVGSDGTVWGVNLLGQIWRWNGSGWEGNIPGRLDQISVGSASHIWGVNASNEIFRWNGSEWTRMPGSLKYVSVGSDGTVWGVDPNDQIFIRQGDSWIQVPGGLNQISVGSSRHIWGVNRNGQIFSRSF